MGDELRLRELLLNVVDNAVKYSYTGGTVNIDIRQEGRHVRIAVTDHGIGIPPNITSKSSTASSARMEPVPTREKGPVSASRSAPGSSKPITAESMSEAKRAKVPRLRSLSRSRPQILITFNPGLILVSFPIVSLHA